MKHSTLVWIWRYNKLPSLQPRVRPARARVHTLPATKYVHKRDFTQSSDKGIIVPKIGRYSLNKSPTTEQFTLVVSRIISNVCFPTCSFNQSS